MWYLSDLINDLAFLFSYIENMESKYADYNLSIDTKVLVFRDGYKVAITPYETIYSRTEEDKREDSF